jgi:hypothetical protein
MVTPLRLRAVTVNPRGKCRSIRLTGGVVRRMGRIAVSSILDGEVLIFHPVFWVSIAISISVPSSSDGVSAGLCFDGPCTLPLQTHPAP